MLVGVCDAERSRRPRPPSPSARPVGSSSAIPYGHFDIYSDPKPKADQVAFLSRHLSTGRAGAAR